MGTTASIALAILFPTGHWFVLGALLLTVQNLERLCGVIFLLLVGFGQIDLLSAPLVLIGLSTAVRTFREGYLEQKNLANDRQELLKTLVHELRNPLFAAKGTIDILKVRVREYSVEELEQQLNMASEAMQSINQEVDDLTQLLRLESGRIIARPTRCSAARLYNNLRRRHPEGSCPEHQLVFTGGELELFCDPLLMTQALDKLVSNAITHAPGGNVEVSGHTDGTHAYLEVSDEGPGIPSDERKWVFERHKPANQSSGAFGIGLYLAREYLLAQNCEIVLLDSERGCHFQIRLPL